MPPKRKSVESRSRQVKPKSDINFKWGIEFETHSVIYDENGKDKVPIWEDGKVTITSEMVDIEKNLHPAPFHECKINEKDTTAQGACLFNLESQLGVFNGFSLSINHSTCSPAYSQVNSKNSFTVCVSFELRT